MGWIVNGIRTARRLLKKSASASFLPLPFFEYLCFGIVYRGANSEHLSRPFCGHAGSQVRIEHMRSHHRGIATVHVSIVVLDT